MTQPHTIVNSAGSHSLGDAEVEDSESGMMLVNKWDTGHNIECTDDCAETTYIQAYLYDSACTVTNTDATNLGEFNQATWDQYEYRPGDYSIRYFCQDGLESDARAVLEHEACRDLQNVDNMLPIIQVLGMAEMTIEASHAANYVDDGATCSDQGDGIISQNVEVSGDVVNLSRVGTYVIQYNCVDSHSNGAPTETRTVHVAQTSCPTCSSDLDITTGPFYREAGFVYTDEPVNCEDHIDGPVATHMDGEVDVDTTGTYILTYTAVNSVGLYNYGPTCREGYGPNNYYRTIVVQDTLKPVIQVKYKGVLVERSATDDVGTNEQENPAWDGALANLEESGFMAEATSSSVNGWVIGAVASAVTGLALLGMSA